MNGKYLDPMVPAIAYQLANGARSVWAVPQPTQEQLVNRARDRFYRDAAAYCSRWAVTNG
jgi:hypothetical protein